MVWGIDIGGTKLEGVVLESASSATPIARERIDTEAEQGYEHILSRTAELLKILKSKSGTSPSVIGVGHPGATDTFTGLLKNSNTTALNGKPFISDLEKTLGLDVRSANDANCFTLAEAKLGAAKGFDIVFGVILGTGVGGSIFVSGKIIQGRHGIAGEWGHNVLDPQGVTCYCGKRGCVETVLSGPGLEKFYALHANKSMKLEDIAATANTDQIAARTLDRLYDHFGNAIASVVNILDPDCIILGGGVSNIEGLYTRGREAILPHLFNDRFDAPILKHSLGDSAGVFGAALLTA
ncbi:MAG: ROK family protein [Bdellovibrionales bacterium]|nr:ROK family protein [Bdellovibrionales bacterium]